MEALFHSCIYSLFLASAVIARLIDGVFSICAVPLPVHKSLLQLPQLARLAKFTKEQNFH